MEKQLQLTNSKEIIAFLTKQFPKSFSIEGEALPLKIGIFKDIVARLEGQQLTISKTQLRAALRVYTSSWRYLHGVKNVAYRVDLDGNQDEPIDAQHVEFAAQKLKEGKARVNAARKAQLAKQKANKEASPAANQSKKSV